MDLEERVNAALQMIPTCDRCKRLKRKCDTDLPSCRLCSAVKQTCEFKDHVLQEVVPRSHLKYLLDRWSKLRQEETSAEVLEPGLSSPSSQIQPGRLDFDAHFPSSDGDDAFIFFGSSSVYVLSTELLAAVCPQSSLLNRSSDLTAGITPRGASDGLGMVDATLHMVPSRGLILNLVETYERSCALYWPLQLEPIDNDALDSFLQSTTYQKKVAPIISNSTTIAHRHTTFQITMICAIASAHASRVNFAMSAYEQFFYDHASKLMNQVLSEATAESLVDLLLLIIYLLFRPNKGDLWMLLESACRLAVELGYHRDHARLLPMPLPEDVDVDQKKLSRSRTFWTLQMLEHGVAEMYGRPSDDLESISTIDIPANILKSHSSQERFDHRSNTISSSLARLSRLRSAVFKTIYLPAKAAPSIMDDSFYQATINEADRLYQDLSQGRPRPEILSETSFKISYHSFIVFLHQKNLLQVLSSISSSSPMRANNTKSASTARVRRSFDSACEIIECYESVILSGEEDGLRVPEYPVTIVSAHEICAASMTIMAYCFCVITDSQVRSALRSESFTAHRRSLSLEYAEHRKSDVVAASCISLLTWCAIRWQGMSGMLEIFKELWMTMRPKLSGENFG